MSDKLRNPIIEKIYKFLSAICVSFGITFMVLGVYCHNENSDALAILFSEIGAVLLSTGILHFAIDKYIKNEEQEKFEKAIENILNNENSLISKKIINHIDAQNVKFEDIKSEIIRFKNTINNVEALTSEVKDKILFIDESLKGNNKLIELISKQNPKVRTLLIHAERSNIFLKNFFNDLIEQYHRDFNIANNGLEIYGSHSSLNYYITFWKYLLTEQIKYSTENKKMIVRILHSNSIDIWTNDHPSFQKYSEKLYKIQNEFIEYGGNIFRIIIGDHNEPNEIYEKAMKNMRTNKIKTGYLKYERSLGIDYDFLLLSEENLILKWHSDNAGDDLSKTSLHDNVNDDDIDKWKYLYSKLRNNGCEDYDPSFEINS